MSGTRRSTVTASGWSLAAGAPRYRSRRPAPTQHSTSERASVLVTRCRLVNTAECCTSTTDYCHCCHSRHRRRCISPTVLTSSTHQPHTLQATTLINTVNLTRTWANAQRDGRPAVPASRLQHITDLHSKFALRPHHLSKYGRHPICGR